MTDSIEIVVTLLKNAAAVTDIVGVGNYPFEFPQNALPPCNVINRVSRRDEQVLSGAAKYYEARIRVESLAATSEAVSALGKAVSDALEDIVKQTVGDATDCDVRFADNDYTDKADDRSLFRVVQDFMVRYRT